MKMKKLVVVLAACAVLPVVASADIHVTYGGAAAVGGGLTTSVPGAVVDTFSGSRPGWTYAGDGNITIHSATNSHATPWGDTTAYFCLPAVDGSQIPPASVFVSGFGSDQNYLGLYWGSVDSYNRITFYDGDQVVDSFAGAAITSPQEPDGNWVGSDTNKYVNFLFTDGTTFDKIELYTSGIAFELDNLAIARVPVPGAVLLGFLGLGAAGMRLRKRV